MKILEPRVRASLVRPGLSGSVNVRSIYHIDHHLENRNWKSNRISTILKSIQQAREDCHYCHHQLTLILEIQIDRPGIAPKVILALKLAQQLFLN